MIVLFSHFFAFYFFGKFNNLTRKTGRLLERQEGFEKDMKVLRKTGRFLERQEGF